MYYIKVFCPLTCRDCLRYHLHFLSTNNFKSFLVSSNMFPSWYFVCSLSSIFRILRCFIDMRNSFAKVDMHSKILAPVSTLIYSLSVKLCVYVAFIDLVHTTLFLMLLPIYLISNSLYLAPLDNLSRCSMTFLRRPFDCLLIHNFCGLKDIVVSTWLLPCVFQAGHTSVFSKFQQYTTILGVLYLRWIWVYDKRPKFWVRISRVSVQKSHAIT